MPSAVSALYTHTTRLAVLQCQEPTDFASIMILTPSTLSILCTRFFCMIHDLGTHHTIVWSVSSGRVSTQLCQERHRHQRAPEPAVTAHSLFSTNVLINTRSATGRADSIIVEHLDRVTIGVILRTASADSRAGLGAGFQQMLFFL
jgi:hypothetical protein